MQTSTLSDARSLNDKRLMCSVIIPVYNERDNVRAMNQALGAVAEAEPSLDWEFLFVEDGSTDETFAILSDVNQSRSAREGGAVEP